MKTIQHYQNNTTLTWSVNPRFLTSLRKMASAIGERHMLPADRYTNKTDAMLNRQHLPEKSNTRLSYCNTHTRLMALCPGLPGSASTRKVKPIWILLQQETLSGSGISWVICKSALRSRQTATPAPHHSSFLQAGCPSCKPTNSVKALKALSFWKHINKP